MPRFSLHLSLPAIPLGRKLMLVAVAAQAATTWAADPAALAESARCSMCHHADEKRMGPSYAAVAERYRGDDGALQTLTERVRKGGSGQWGPAPMPPVTEAQLSDEDLQAVVAWVLQQ